MVWRLGPGSEEHTHSTIRFLPGRQIRLESCFNIVFESTKALLSLILGDWMCVRHVCRSTGGRVEE